MAEDFNETVIGNDIEFRGTLRYNKKITIRGKIKGLIESSGDLIISETGEIQADIHVANLEVSGQLTGNILASSRIKIGKSGKINGDIQTPVLEIEAGGKFTGNCIM